MSTTGGNLWPPNSNHRFEFAPKNAPRCVFAGRCLRAVHEFIEREAEVAGDLQCLVEFWGTASQVRIDRSVAEAHGFRERPLGQTAIPNGNGESRREATGSKMIHFCVAWKQMIGLILLPRCTHHAFAATRKTNRSPT